MAVSDQFCLRWNDHQSTLLTTFDTLLDSQKLTDVTLWAGGKCLKAHKVVLSACSPYFDKMLETHDEKNPIIVFNDLSYEQLRAMLEYMYRGEVNVSQEQLDSFLKVAESLKIKGLTDQGGGSDIKGGGSKKKPIPPAVPAAISKDRESSNLKRKRPHRRGSESGTESVEDEIKSDSGTGSMLQPKVELTEDNGGGGGGVEDLTMMEEEDDEDYYHHQSTAGSSRLTDEGAVPTPHPPPDLKDFSGWDMTNDSFIGAQEMSGNNALNSSQVKLELETTHEFVCQTHEGPFICDFCQKKYKHKRTLMTHKKYECENSLTVSGPHICDSCGKIYKHRRNLCAHKKYDCGMEPQFACIICSRKFKFKSNLKAHLNACHKKHIVFPLSTFSPNGFNTSISSLNSTLSQCEMPSEAITSSGISSSDL